MNLYKLVRTHFLLGLVSTGWTLPLHVQATHAATNVFVVEITAPLLGDYEAAANGNKETTQNLFVTLTKLNKHNPDSALVMSLLGSVETMMARDSFIPWRQLKYLEHGIEKIDRGISMLRPQDAVASVQGVPITLWVKNTAGCTYIEIPAIFNRLESGYKILQEAIESKEVSSLPFEKLASTYLCAGTAAKKLRNTNAARRYLEPIVEKMPSTYVGMHAASLLKELVMIESFRRTLSASSEAAVKGGRNE